MLLATDDSVGRTGLECPDSKCDCVMMWHTTLDPSRCHPEEGRRCPAAESVPLVGPLVVGEVREGVEAAVPCRAVREVAAAEGHPRQGRTYEIREATRCRRSLRISFVLDRYHGGRSRRSSREADVQEWPGPSRCLPTVR